MVAVIVSQSRVESKIPQGDVPREGDIGKRLGSIMCICESLCDISNLLYRFTGIANQAFGGMSCSLAIVNDRANTDAARISDVKLNMVKTAPVEDYQTRKV